MTAVLPAGRLVYGMQLPIQSQSTQFAEPWEATAGAAELEAVARAADTAGFWYLGVCDHVAVPEDHAASMGTDWWDNSATLGWLAGVTRQARLLSHVTVPAYRHPLEVAKAWTTLDALSGGRAIMGVGAGHLEAEFDMLGVDFTKRGPLLDESIDALRVAFADEFPSFEGDTWSFSGMGLRPRPTTPGGPPIWVGGSSKPALRRAAERGDGWLPQGPVTPAIVAFLREHRARNHRAGPFDIGALVGAVYVGDPAWDVGACLSGPPEKLAHVLRKYAQLGVGQIQLRLRSRSVDELVEQIEAFGSQVGPLLNGSNDEES